MPIGISDDHVELADAFGKWAGSLGGIEAARAAEDDPAAAFPEIIRGGRRDGAARHHRPTAVSLTDLAVAVEACAAALLPGPLLGSAVASVALPELAGPVALSLDGHGWSTTPRARPTPSSWWTTRCGSCRSRGSSSRPAPTPT